MFLRKSPSGEFLDGDSVGDYLAWMGPAIGWEPTPFPAIPPPTEQAFDYIIKSRQDLVDVVAPAAGVFNLPNGSYAWAGGFALNAEERLAVPDSGRVYIQGMGPQAYAEFDVSTADNLVTVGGAGARLNVFNWELTSVNAEVSTKGFENVNGGFLNVLNTRLSMNGGNPLRTASNTVWDGGQLVSQNGDVLTAAGGGVGPSYIRNARIEANLVLAGASIEVDQCHIGHNRSDPSRIIDLGQGTLDLRNSRVEWGGNAAASSFYLMFIGSPVGHLRTCSNVRFVGNTAVVGTSVGIQWQRAAGGRLNVSNGCVFDDLNYGMFSGNPADNWQVSDSYFEGNVDTGIFFDVGPLAATLSGNAFRCTTAAVAGATPATAGHNWKANSSTSPGNVAGNLLETAIVV